MTPTPETPTPAPRRRRTPPTERDRLVERVCSALVSLLDFTPLVHEERGDLEGHLANLSDAALGQTVAELEGAYERLGGHLPRRGWTWRTWGRRRHFFDGGGGRTLCGRAWDGGLLMQGRHDDPERCRSCAASLAKRREEAR